MGQIPRSTERISSFNFIFQQDELNALICVHVKWYRASWELEPVLIAGFPSCKPVSFLYIPTNSWVSFVYDVDKNYFDTQQKQRINTFW